MPNEYLKNLLTSAGERMVSELRESLIPHRGELGLAREEVIRKFLRAYLPKRYEVSSGFVFDSTGDVSQQLDVIITDSTIAPRFETAGGIRFYPCESVVAVGQIKSQLSSQRELWGAIENVRSVSLLDRSAGGHAVCVNTGEPIDHTQNHLHRIFTFIFIIDRAISSDTATSVLLEAVQRSHPHEWPNLIFSLKHYLITYCCDQGICPNTMHARGISTVKVGDNSEGLLRFYLLLTQAISTTSVARMSSWEYLHEFANLSGATVVTSATTNGEPPPYLDTLTNMPWSSTLFDDIHDAEDS